MKYLKKYNTSTTHEGLSGHPELRPMVCATEDKHVYYHSKTQPGPQPETRTVNITYIDRLNSTTTTEQATGMVGSPIAYTVSSAPETIDNNHTFIGWSTTGYPTYEQTQAQGFLKQPSSIQETNSDVTLYANYSILFQALIDEGYVTVSNAQGATESGNILLTVSSGANVYPKELVTDFMDVFGSAEGKKVSIGGVVGEGTAKNVFFFSSLSNTWNYWLSPDEWYDIYNNTPLNHLPQQLQFYGMDWHDKESVTIIYSPSGGSSVWCFGNSIYGPKFPETLNIDLGENDFANVAKTFGHHSNGCSSKYINITTARYSDGKVWPSRGGANLYYNAAFEGCENLLTFSGFNTTNCWNFAYTFDGCKSIQIITTDELGSEIGIRSDMQQMFCNCWELSEIQTVLNVTNVGNTTSAFYGCSQLETMYLKGINAASNVRSAVNPSFPQNTAVTWELKNTVLSQSCVDYIVSNVTPCDTTVEGFTYKVINFPAGTTLTNSQIETLYNEGWIAWINDVVAQIEVPAL